MRSGGSGPAERPVASRRSARCAARREEPAAAHPTPADGHLPFDGEEAAEDRDAGGEVGEAVCGASSRVSTSGLIPPGGRLATPAGHGRHVMAGAPGGVPHSYASAVRGSRSGPEAITGVEARGGGDGGACLAARRAVQRPAEELGAADGGGVPAPDEGATNFDEGVVTTSPVGVPGGGEVADGQGWTLVTSGRRRSRSLTSGRGSRRGGGVGSEVVASPCNAPVVRRLEWGGSPGGGTMSGVSRPGTKVRSPQLPT